MFFFRISATSLEAKGARAEANGIEACGWFFVREYEENNKNTIE